jgi:prevent-host-death family protein
MKTVTAADAKNRFGQFLDMAQREPVLVTKNDRPVGVFLSMQDFEDSIWAGKAQAAHERGYASADDSAALIQKWLKASD